MCGEAAEEYCGAEEEEGECVSGDEYPDYCTLCDDFDHSVCPEDDKCCCALCDDMEEPTCDCVAEDDFDALVDHVSMQAEEIAALQEELAALDAASLEATVNDVDSELSMLSACVASVMDGTYVEPEPMSSSPTTPSMTLK